MKFFSAVLLVLSCSSAVQPATLMDTTLQQKLDDLRPKLKDVSIRRVSLGPRNVLRNLRFSHLEHFSYHTDCSLFPPNLNNLTLTLDFLNVNGFYDFGAVKLPGPVTLFGKGNMNVRVEDIKFFLSAKLVRCPGVSPKCGVRYCIGDLNPGNSIDVYVGAFRLHMENLLDGGPVGSFVSSLISNVVPSLVQSAKGVVFKNYKQKIIHLINERLRRIVVVGRPPTDPSCPHP